MLCPPDPDVLHGPLDRAAVMAGRLAAGSATYAHHGEPSPTLDALIHGFMARVTEPGAAPFGLCAAAAIRALEHVAPDMPSPAPAPRPTPGKPAPDIQETEHTPMLEAVVRPAAERVTPAMPGQAVPPGMARSLTEIEVAGGSSPADARARMNETAAIRQAAEEATPLPFDPISAADMRGHLDVLTAELRALVSRAAPGMAAD